MQSAVIVMPKAGNDLLVFISVIHIPEAISQLVPDGRIFRRQLVDIKMVFPQIQCELMLALFVGLFNFALLALYLLIHLLLQLNSLLR